MGEMLGFLNGRLLSDLHGLQVCHLALLAQIDSYNMFNWIFSQDELIKVTNEKKYLDEQLKNFHDTNTRESSQLEIENRRLNDNLNSLRVEYELNQKSLKSQNDTLNRKQQVRSHENNQVCMCEN